MPSHTPTELPTTRPPSPSPSHTPTERPTPSPSRTPTIAPTRTPTRVLYVKARNSVVTCPSGYTRITSASECLNTARTALSLRNKGSSSSWGSYPKGCFAYSGSYAYFNTGGRTSGSTYSNSAVICKSTVTAAPVTWAPGTKKVFAYKGWALWSQNRQAHATQERLMNAACATKFKGSRAITIRELVSSSTIVGKPSKNPTSHYLVPTCGSVPARFCQKVSNNARFCLNPRVKLPSTIPPSGWNPNCYSSTRSTLCVGQSKSLKSARIEVSMESFSIEPKDREPESVNKN